MAGFFDKIGDFFGGIVSIFSGLGATPDLPAPAPIIQPPEPLKQAEAQIQTAQDDTRKKAAKLAAVSGTNPTGALGLSTTAQTTGKSLLGQ